MLPKIIDCNKFVSRGGVLHGILERGEFTRNKGLFSIENDVSVKLVFDLNQNGEVILDTDVSAAVSADCQRCLEIFEFEIRKSGEFAICESDDGSDEKLLLNEGRDIFYVNNGKLDVLRLIEDELLLAVPMIPRHEDMSSCSAMKHEPFDEGVSVVRKPFAGLRELIDTTDTD